MTLFPTGTASFDPTGTYRYTLTRSWSSGPRLVCIGVNPSTADATKDDATIRRVIAFARDSGQGSLAMLNLFGFRSTDIRGLRTAKDPVGPGNDAAILRECLQPDTTIVCAWGPPRKVPALLRPRFAEVVALLRMHEVPLHVLALTEDGHPRHPLMLKSICRPTLWAG